MSLFKKKKESNPLNFSFEKKVNIPKTAQDTIPFIEAYDNGIFLVDENKYTLLFTFENLDYSLLREEEQQELIHDYEKLMNGLPTDVSYQEFIMNRSINEEKLRAALAVKNNRFEELSADYEKIMEEKIRQASTACAEKIMVIALCYSPVAAVDSANVLFKYYRELQTYFSKLKVNTKQLMPEDVFRLLHQYYHPFDTDEFLLPTNYFSRGGHIKDYIAPSCFAFKPNEVEVGESFTRVLFMQRYDRDLDDEFIRDMADNNFKIAVSKHVRRIDKTEALEKVRKEIFNVQVKIQKRMEDNHKRGGNFIPFDMQDKLKELEDIQNKLAGSLLELFEVALFISVSASSKEELEEICKSIRAKAQNHQVKLGVLTRQQERGMNSVLPFANNQFSVKNNNCISTYLLTDATSILIPFSYNTYFTENGIFYGMNQLTNAAIILDRTDEMNSNGFIYGTSGSGKSTFTKLELEEVLMKYPDDEIIVIDPENEYEVLVQKENFDGEILKVAPNSSTKFNIFDIDLTYSEDGKDAVALKSEFIMTIVETAKGMKLTSDERSLIDRCVRDVYQEYILSGGKDDSKLPTLTSLYNELCQQKEAIAEHLALVLELYVKGSFNSFADRTNVNTEKNFIVLDISQMGEQLRSVGLQIILEYLWQRVKNNKRNGIRTWVWIDEFSVMFGDNESSGEMHSGQFFTKVYSRIRKYGGVATAITQNITGMLASKQAVEMMGNAEFTVLLQQKKENLEQIVKIFELSENQAAFLKNGERGTGLIICGKKVIPFDKNIPHSGKIYNMISTDFKEYQKKLGETV